VRPHVSRGGDHLPVLAFEGLFATPVEKVRDVRVLLGLCATKLRFFVACENFWKDVGVRFLWEGDRKRERRVVRGHAYVSGEGSRRGPGAVELRTRGIGERLGDLTCSIGAEVEEDGRVLTSIDASVVPDDDGLDELVSFAGRVRVADGGERRGSARRVG